MSNTHQNTLEALYSKRDDIRQDQTQDIADYSQGLITEATYQHRIQDNQRRRDAVDIAIRIVSCL